ncbi:Tim44 domain-containing protein [Pusillimonas sp. CC-YST705]|uniref:Tim44 domain-containing protein n=1 Tax=Mesopusillimonas faecipullorum TaxID=2755040 RepID=A0ABS8CBX5_9BURK|nr:TIM44-like domain-containing protein [Mesopusillimonas faecipullorum]MCB5363535.1 Tim44 domain-containing protein [Mesopusillimonas faecipullorum]
MTHKFTRFLAGVMLTLSAVVLMATSFDAEARRMGGGKSFGRQSSNVTQQRQAVQPPAAATTQRSAATGAAAASGAARTGMSRFLGPLAGIAAGLGIAALLSHLGLGGALLEFLSSAILIAIVVFGVMFLIRRLRGASSPATQAAGGMQRNSQQPQASPSWQTSMPSAAAPAPAQVAEPQQVLDPSWFIPADFDLPTFLANAKQQFATIQGIWDKGDVDALSEYLTDDLIAEFRGQIEARQDQNQTTEILLLNAELLGIEQVAGGHLASVRYSGMLREAPGAEGFHFEEVWNLYKAEGQGWLLAGIQQISGQSTH